MSIRQRKVFVPVLLATLALGTLALVVARSGSNRNRLPSPPVSSPIYLPVQTKSSTQPKTPRNLSLQPEAFDLARRLGRRFSPANREQSIIDGLLVIGSESQSVRTTRTQTNDGEQVMITSAGSQDSLTWDRNQGALTTGARARGANRDLIERLVLDSPDQFVLAQLRGASYYTVGRNVRPHGAGENYTGPVWNIVRVTDPEPDAAKQPQSRWRLYYLNTATGLIDRILSEAQGQRISAEITWTKSSQEQVPMRIVWKRQGQTIMQYNLTNFTHAEPEGARQ